MIDLTCDLDDATIAGVKRRMAQDGPLLETCHSTADGQAIFMCADRTVPLREKSVQYLAARRIVHIDGEKPNRIARLLS